MNNDLNDIFDRKQLEGNPFKVPSGYFETLNSRIMENVAKHAQKEEKPAQAKRVSMHTLRWTAACVCVIVLSASAILFASKFSDAQEVATSSQQTTTSDDAFNQAADYAMLDNCDMYQMLAEE